MAASSRVPSSFRDPAGFLYVENGVLLRQVQPSYARHYDLLMQSGLYDALVRRGLLVPHEEVPSPPGAYRTLRPAVVPYVSYPYEWCFSQLKDAALLTLDIQIESLARDLMLKDASAYNIQFIGSAPVLIDTLSFEAYEDGAPWPAYRQFCQHFLAPLALMAHRDVRLRGLLARHVDGIPLDLASTLLPRRTRLRYGLLAHLHLHARSQRRHQDAGTQGEPVRVPRVPRDRMIALMHSLRGTIERCTLPTTRTEWSGYYAGTNYSTAAMAAKEASVVSMVDALSAPGAIVHDLGANTGRFSRLIARSDRYVVSHDVDDGAVEENYAEVKRAGRRDVLPLVLDLTNPSPAAGWESTERQSALDRMAGGTVVALALVHHLAIGNNVPLDRLAALFARIARALVIEFVPKEDSQVRRLLATRRDIFPDYTREGFEAAFSGPFEIVSRQPVEESVRTIYGMRRRL